MVIGDVNACVLFSMGLPLLAIHHDTRPADRHHRKNVTQNTKVRR